MLRFILTTLIAVTLSFPAGARERVALVIGNANYVAAGQLPNAARDARDIAATLERFGYEVTRALNLDRQAMATALQRFGRAADGAEIALVYYAGHGIQVGGTNYLLPTDAALYHESDAQVEAITLDYVLLRIAGARRLSMVVLDACRNNPLANRIKGTDRGRSVDRGLARPSRRPANSLVAFSAAAGAITPDGPPGGNSPYTKAFLAALEGPPVDVRRLLGGVRDDVRSDLGPEADPAVYQSLGRAEFIINPRAGSEAIAPPSPGRDAVSAAQGLLNGLGYDAGPVDGVKGRQTTQALEAFQRRAGLPATGVADARTLDALRAAAAFAGGAAGGGTEVAVGITEPPVAPPQRQQYRDLSRFRDCPDCPEMVVIPAGRFWMGSPEGEGSPDERPQRKVTIGKFALSRTEVTFDAWRACVDDGFCRSNRSPSDEGWGRGNRPVIGVSWHDIAGERGFVAWMNSKVSGEPYRLPSEAEWEYAARADRDGSKNPPPFHFGATISTDQANYDGNFTYGAGRKGVYRKKTVPVDDMPLAENRWGLRHMHGNVWEWVQDCWYGSYHRAPEDGTAWLGAGGGDCSLAVVRGGAWVNVPGALRSANRGRNWRVFRFRSHGFRLARTVLE